MTSRPRNVANDMLDAIETATARWTKQKKSEERTPGNIRYRVSRMTKEPTTKQKEAAWLVMEKAYLGASGSRGLPATARQIYYKARPLIMALTDDKELRYKYFSQTLLPDYIEEKGAIWNVVYDARGHFEEPHTNRSIGCGTLEVANYLRANREPKIRPAGFDDAGVSVVGPSGGFSGVLFYEKEGFNPLFKAVDLANRFDLMIVSTKGTSVVSARRLVDDVCGETGLPLFILHDFDTSGFMIAQTLQRDTRRYQFQRNVKAVDLGFRLADIVGLEREPAAATKAAPHILRDQLASNGATPEEIDILLTERVELNAMGSDEFVAMIERKLRACGLKKVVPAEDVLAETYRAFRRSEALREKFEEMEAEFDDEDEEEAIPKKLADKVRAVLKKHANLRWDEAVRIVLDKTTLDRVLEDKAKAKKKSGDFTEGDDDDDA
jgi:hypothetical protein